MSVLTCVQAACRRLGLNVPNAVVTSSDPQIIQMMAIMNEEGEELTERYPWQVLQTEATFTTVATESQGAISTLAPGLKYVTNDTMWNRSQTRPVYGSLNPQGWQAKKASNVTGPYGEYRIRGDTLRFIPAPAAGLTVAFEYLSKNWVSTSVGGTAAAWTNDADTSFLDEQIMTMGLLWRFKQIKGFDYEEDFRKYERRVTNAMARDGTKQVLDAGGPHHGIGLIVPEGSWTIP